MKKSLIALAALSAFATAAQAQSSVSVYGAIDMGYTSNETDFTDTGTQNLNNRAKMRDAKSSGLNLSSPLTSSRLGFRGTEDLGGGLSANFNLEYGFDGNGSLTTLNTSPNAGVRTAIAGLSSKTMGTFNIGKQLTGIHGTIAGYNPLAGNNMVGDVLYSTAFRAHSVSNLAANGTTTSGVAGTAVLQNPLIAATATAAVGDDLRDAIRMNNSISYVTPAFNGITARVDYANDKRNQNAETAGTASTGVTAVTEISTKHQGLTVNYAGGPLRVAVSTHTAKGDSNLGAIGDLESKYNAVSAAYQLTPAISLQASYADAEHKEAGAVTNETKGYRLGANYNVGKWVLAAQYGTGDVSTPTADVATGSASTTYGLATAADRTAYQLAAIYNLSKRTNLYVAYGTQEQKITSANARSTTTTADDRATAAGDKRKDTQMAIGLRHSF
jgi:predicted porin